MPHPSPPEPPAPAIDWAKIPRAASPSVLMVPALVTFTSPLLPPTPPMPPSEVIVPLTDPALPPAPLMVWAIMPPAWLPRAVIEEPEIGRHTSELQSRENLVCRLLLEK